jgi:hypothetical protein
VCLGHVVAPTAPAVTGLSPATGPDTGGTPVTITGTGFDTASGGTAIKFGANDATSVACSSTTSCTATSPAGSGIVDVVVTAHALASATSAADRFTYTGAAVAPTVTGISPTSGSTAGGTSVTITGTGFDTAPLGTTVTFGANAATGAVTCSSTTSCTATSPAGSGTVHVVVTVGGQSSAASPADTFTYVDAGPVMTTVNVPVPALVKGFGYWFTFTSTASGTLNATWTTPSSIPGTLAIYAGTPFSGQPNPVKLSPPTPTLASIKATRASFSVTTGTQPAGTYTVYFFSSKAAPAGDGTVTYMK